MGVFPLFLETPNMLSIYGIRYHSECFVCPMFRPMSLTSKKLSLEQKSFFVLLIMTPKWKDTNIGDTSPIVPLVFSMICGRKRTQDLPIKLLFRVLVFSIHWEKIMLKVRCNSAQHFFVLLLSCFLSEQNKILLVLQPRFHSLPFPWVAWKQDQVPILTSSNPAMLQSKDTTESHPYCWWKKSG